MKNDITKWLQNPAVNPGWTALVCVGWMLGLVAIEQFFPSRQTESRIVAPFLFQSREFLRESPSLHPSIHIFALDDVTVAKLSRPTLEISEWADLLEAFDSKNPEAIIVDALFSSDLEGGAPKGHDGPEAVARLAAIKTPVVTGAFVVGGNIPGRTPLKLDAPAYNLLNYIDTTQSLPLAPEEQAEALQLGNFQGQTPYGPHAGLQGAFRNIGHILYGQQEGRILPFLRLDQSNKVLPHLMIKPFKDARFSRGRLIVNDFEIKMDKDGTIPVNFISPKMLSGKILAFHSVLDRSTRERFLKDIKAGDFVYLIPSYFTGNTDFKPSPIGMTSGAFSHLGVLNSILQKKGLRNLEVEWEVTLAMGAIISFLGWWVSPTALIFMMLGCSLAWTLVVFGSFIYLGIIFPLLLPQLCLIGVGVSLLLHRIYVAERKARVIRHALEGVVRPQALKELQKHPERLSLEARERVVTIMFIDIVGFSLMVENQLPRVAFEGLQDLIRDMSDRIHEHGGIVNKTLGDGLLCFFGYSLEDDKETLNHAEEALEAALSIQKSNLPRILATAHNREPVFPLRIGINTAAVFMGNLGAGERLDITVIGNGVNFAKRLESACQPHSILIGTNTQELIQPKSNWGAPIRRLISIKHHQDMVEAWEYDPFENEPEQRRQADEIFENLAQITRMERRWSVLDKENIQVTTLSGTGHLLNFSATGLSFSLKTMLPRGATTTLELDSTDGVLRRHLNSAGLAKIQVEVRWVQTRGQEYIHGIRYLDLNNRQLEIITDLLCQFGLEKEQSSSPPMAS